MIRTSDWPDEEDEQVLRKLAKKYLSKPSEKHFNSLFEELFHLGFSKKDFCREIEKQSEISVILSE